MVICPLLAMMVLAQARVNPDAAIVQDFEKRVADYVAIQKNAVKEVGALKPTKEPGEITEHSRALAKAIRGARPKAVQGDIFSPQISKEFRRLIGLAMEGNAVQIHKSLERSEPVSVKLRVNDSYPAHVPLQSTPPTLLMNLPTLPPDLEYRLVGRTLALRDNTANLIVDLMTNAIP